MTLRELIARTAQRFRAAGLHYGHGAASARDEAAWLVLRGLGLPFDTDPRLDVDDARVEPLVRKRIADRMPTAYLLGEAWLDGVPFHVDRRVIVPRSHIAFLLKELRTKPRRVVDLCTGSGCLAILAARAFPRARVDATDLSPGALAVARRNVARHKLGRRVRLVKGDLFAGLSGPYDLVLANPPYVASRAMKALPPEYRWEPGLALAGGGNGLDLVHRVLSEAPSRMTPGALLVCEVGDGQRELERAYPGTAFMWPVPEVFVLERSRIPSAAGRSSRRGQARR